MPARARSGQIRHRATRRTGRRVAVVLLAAVATAVAVLIVAPAATTAWADRHRAPSHVADARASRARTTVTSPASAPSPTAAASPAPASAPGSLPVPTGLGPSWAARLAGHAQVVIASGEDWNAPHAVVTEWQRTPGGWTKLGSWTGWNGRGGWTTTPAEVRPQSPVGVFTLTDAGGYEPNPGSHLPYDHSRARYSLTINGVRAFNHVIAINYNRVPGTAPADQTRPLGYAAGGGFWIHTQHDSGTSGCIAIPDAGVVQLQQTLDPAANPVIVMAPAAVLAQ